MKHTLLYLKAIALVLVALAMIIGWSLGTMLGINGIVIMLATRSLVGLAYMLLGFVLGLYGAAAEDLLIYLTKRWEL